MRILPIFAFITIVWFLFNSKWYNVWRCLEYKAENIKHWELLMVLYYGVLNKYIHVNGQKIDNIHIIAHWDKLHSVVYSLAI